MTNILKRVGDIIVSLIIMPMVLPVGLIIAISIWIEDRHNPIFTQERFGKGKRIFTLYKFRTMKSDNNWTVKDVSSRDDRLTKVGAAIRTYNLDELPQVINILKGDMSIVGPRPIPVSMDVDNIRYWDYRSIVRPGVTGLAQIGCTKYTTLEHKFRHDARYVSTYSIWLDIKILAQTIYAHKEIVIISLWTLLVYYLLVLMPFDETPYGDADKASHLTLWSISTILFYHCFKKLFRQYWIYIAAFLYCLLMAVSTEILQGFTGRHPDIFDFIFDMVGFFLILPFVSGVLPEKRNKDVKDKAIH